MATRPCLSSIRRERYRVDSSLGKQRWDGLEKWIAVLLLLGDLHTHGNMPQLLRLKYLLGKPEGVKQAAY